MQVTVAHPLGFELDAEVLARAGQLADAHGGSVTVVNDLAQGAKGAAVLYGRSWGSIKYWNDPEREAMVKRSLQSWQIDQQIMSLTADAVFMHPLPVRRNVAVSDDVLDGPRSVIYDQAENRLHVQKAILTELLLG
jgi:ornithine carbamoyltransferase